MQNKEAAPNHPSLTIVQERIENNWELANATIPFGAVALASGLASIPKAIEGEAGFIVLPALGILAGITTLIVAGFQPAFNKQGKQIRKWHKQ